MARFFGFRPNPKQQIIDLARYLYGVAPYRVKVVGRRVTELEESIFNLRRGTYYVEVRINDDIKATASHVNWRKAYRALLEELRTNHDRIINPTFIAPVSSVESREKELV